MGKISVAVVSYHTGPILARCIDSVLKQKDLEELILVDNGNNEVVRHQLKSIAKKHKAINR